MIDSSFPCSSSWDFTEPLEDFSDMTFAPFDDFNRIERTCSAFENSSRYSDSSSSTSDYDCIQFGDLVLPLTDSFISGILEESDSSELQDTWSVLEDVSCTVPVDVNSNVKKSSKKKRKSLDYLPDKLWSLMSLEEQLETLHKLSKIVTSHMGIRQQIKVIKIIDPAATISPNDTEFALDVSRLNDEKLKRILELVRKHEYSLSNSKKLKTSSKNITPEKQSLSSKFFSGRTASKTKRKQKKQKSDIDEDVRQKRKLELHGQKEMRSGLFVYEKVVKLSCPVEDEDVNILE